MPDHLDDVWGILETEPETLVYAGGTDILVKLRAGFSDSPTHRFASSLICLERIDELKDILETDGQIFIGSCVTHTKLIESMLIQKSFPVLVKAVKVLGSPPIRNMGTIGGNICTASPAGDTLPPLYVLGAFVELRSAVSSRLVSLKSFIKGPGSTTIQKGEIVYGVWINKNQDYNVWHYEKVGQRKALAIAIAGFAAMLKLSGSGIIEKARLAWGSVAPIVVSSDKIEKSITGKPLTIETLRQTAEFVHEAVSPIDDIRASVEYRRVLACNMLFRLLKYIDHGNI